MSVRSSISQSAPQALALPVFVTTIDGAKLPAVQHSSVVLSEYGQPEIVEGSIFYVDAQGDEIPNVVELSVNTEESEIYWFSNDSGQLAYWQNGQYYNPDRTPFTEDLKGFVPVGASNSSGPSVTRSPVFIKANDEFFEATEVIAGDSIAYQIDGKATPIASGWKIYRDLPACVYQDFHTIVTDVNEQIIPQNLPISGVTVAYTVPMYRTKNNPGPSSVTIGSVTRTYSGDYALNAETDLSEVIPPFVSVTGQGYAEVVYRQRVSPLMGAGAPTFLPQAVAMESPKTSEAGNPPNDLDYQMVA